MKVQIKTEQLFDIKPSCGVEMCSAIGCLPDVIDVEVYVPSDNSTEEDKTA